MAFTYSAIAPHDTSSPPVSLTPPIKPPKPAPVKPQYIKYSGNYDCNNFEITAAELKKHTKCSLFDAENNDFWMVVNKHVYDLSNWGPTLLSSLSLFFLNRFY